MEWSISSILRMDGILHHFETMVETRTFVGIYVGESSFQWCGMDFATIHSRVCVLLYFMRGVHEVAVRPAGGAGLCLQPSD